MKASELIKHIQTQIENYGDCDIEVCTMKDAYASIQAITYNTFGTIQIIIK